MATQKINPQLLLITLLLAGLLFSLACSAGRLLVQQGGTPTPTVVKTARPTYTYTPIPTETFTPTPTLTPEAPTATPVPEYPFEVAYFTHDTGSSEQTRLTAWVRQDAGPGLFRTLEGFQLIAVGPDGNTYTSEPSGSDFESSTAEDAADNHNMNAQIQFSPYTPGLYRVHLVEGGVQVSPDIEITLTEESFQYIHFDFSRPGQ